LGIKRDEIRREKEFSKFQLALGFDHDIVTERLTTSSKAGSSANPSPSKLSMVNEVEVIVLSLTFNWQVPFESVVQLSRPKSVHEPDTNTPLCVVSLES